jgi:hypothetical protein
MTRDEIDMRAAIFRIVRRLTYSQLCELYKLLIQHFGGVYADVEGKQG